MACAFSRVPASRRHRNEALGKGKAAGLNLPIVEIPGVNPDLQGPDFKSSAIYIIATRWDEFDDSKGFRRVFRY